MNSSHTAAVAHSTSNSVINTPLNRPPLSAQESREKRLAHQQSRFRDRGGIFVPQQRSALLDILLGKTTLKQVTARRSRSRSTSRSPMRRKSGRGSTGDTEGSPLLSRAKKGPKSAVAVVNHGEDSVAGPSRHKQVAATRKPHKKAITARARKSTAEASIPNKIIDSDDLVTHLPTVLSNTRTSRNSAAGKGKEKATAEEEAGITGEKNSRRRKAASSKAIVAKLKDKVASQSRSEATRTSTHCAVPNPVLPGNSDQNSDHASDYPSSPLARRGKKRAAAKFKNYIENDTDQEEIRHRKISTKSKAKFTVPKRSVKKQRQEADPQEKTDVKTTKQRGERLALTPVPEEPEPESENENENLAACLAQDLAAAISKTVENFAPISRDKVKDDKPSEKHSVVGKLEEKRKNASTKKAREKGLVVKGTAVSKETCTDSKGGGRDSVSAEERNKHTVNVGEKFSVPSGESENVKATTIGKGLTKTKVLDDANEDPRSVVETETAAFPSLSRPPKRRMAVVEPEGGAGDNSTSSRTRKKSRTVETSAVDVPVPISTSTLRKGKSEPSQGDEIRQRGTENSNNASCIKNDASRDKQNKRKRAAVIAEADDYERDEPEPESKKKRKEEIDSRKSDREKGTISTSEPDSPAKSRLKTASRKQKENSVGSATVAPAKSKSTDTSKASPLTKKDTRPQSQKPSSTYRRIGKRGPPQSVLDRIKKSAAVNSLHHVDDEPDELDLLSCI